MRVSLGILSNLDFDFWIQSNDYYSPDFFSTNVKTGFNHSKKAGLIGKFEKRINCNLDLINIIDERINLANAPESYSDDDLLIIFDLIQAWDGPTGRNPYIFQNGPRIIKQDLFAKTYRAAIEMLYKIAEEYDYDMDVLPIKAKIEECFCDFLMIKSDIVCKLTEMDDLFDSNPIFWQINNYFKKIKLNDLLYTENDELIISREHKVWIARIRNLSNYYNEIKINK